ncbi:MAG: flagellar hook-basal body complex protein FliE [Spirochaetales bacterium]|nr:flagellar hook-basal body complex protein FliE [Spirochaetales bacterium]
MDVKNMALGDQVVLKRTSTRHMNSEGTTGNPVNATAGGKSFAELMVSKLDNVNEGQNQVNELYEAMMTDPDSVSSDQITIAMAEAEMALGLTKAVVDKAVSAYKEIINLR